MRRNEMKKTPLRRGNSQLRRSGFKVKSTVPMKRTRLNVVGKSTTAQDKKEIQRLLRDIVILRDRKCILHGLRCHHEYGIDDVVWQAEHLIERSNSATYGDSRLVVLVCRNCHGWKHFKKSNHDQYDRWVKTKISEEREKLWEKCEEDSWRVSKMDWKLVIVGLRQELNELSTPPVDVLDVLGIIRR